jgi:hypothetical protein
MGLQDLEKTLSNLFEGIFAKGSHQIQPVEVARALVREMTQQRKVSVSRIYAPNLFKVHLGRADYDKSLPLHEALSQELVDHVRAKAAEKSFTLIGRIEMSFVEDETLGMGDITVETSFIPSEPVHHPSPSVEVPHSTGQPAAGLDHTMIFRKNEIPPQKEKQIAVAVVSGPDKGQGVTMEADGHYIIGRKSTNQVVLTDINASREHAALECRDGIIYLTDLGSRNGIYVNGLKVDQQCCLEIGDQIQIGENILQVEGV